MNRTNINRMEMRTKVTGLVIAIAIIAGSCGAKKEKAWQQSGISVMPVIEVPSKTMTGYDTYPVRIEGTINSEVIAKVGGYITNVLVDEGQFVKQGQMLFKLETQSLSENAKAAKANIDAAQVRVNQLIPLVEKNIISPVELETAKAQLAQAKANYESIVANIGYTDIKSPVDGYVGAIPYRNGTLVSPTSPKPLTVVSQTDNVYAYFSMNETEYLNFLQHTPGKTLEDKIKNLPAVKLKLSNDEIYSEEGHIKTVTAQIDPATGTVSFRATFPNPNHLLANGSSGMILIPKLYENVALVPELSSYEQQGRTMIYQVVGDTLATPVVIEELDRIDKNILVKSGIKAGDKIVAVGADKLKGPTRIVPKPVAYDSVMNSVKVIFR